MSQTFPVNDFKWVEEASEFNENWVKSYNDENYELDVDVMKMMFNILKICITFTMIYLFLPEKMKIEKNKIILANLNDKEEYFIHIRNLKQGLNHRLVF